MERVESCGFSECNTVAALQLELGLRKEAVISQEI